MWVCCVLYVVLYRALLHTGPFYWKISLIKQGKTSGYLPTVHVSPTVAVPVPVAYMYEVLQEVQSCKRDTKRHDPEISDAGISNQ